MFNTIVRPSQDLRPQSALRLPFITGWKIITPLEELFDFVSLPFLVVSRYLYSHPVAAGEAHGDQPHHAAAIVYPVVASDGDRPIVVPECRENHPRGSHVNTCVVADDCGRLYHTTSKV